MFNNNIGSCLIPQMYKKNEKAFEHDVRRFMIRQDRPITRLPEWRGVPVSLFQLFLAVYDRGGFDQVTESINSLEKDFKSGRIMSMEIVVENFFPKSTLIATI